MTTEKRLTDTFPDFLDLAVDTVAPRLLGCVLERRMHGRRVAVRIVETEAYDQLDEASHAYRGQTMRNATMFGKSGHLYVYFTYGMHYCCNVVTGPRGYGAGVLVRAVEPISGSELLEAQRGVKGVAATNGPAKLCQALSIDRSMNGHDLRKVPLQLSVGGLAPGETIVSSPRIGITRARDLHHRYYIAGNPYVSPGPR